MTASTSISTFHSGLSNAATTTVVLAGRMSLNTAPVAAGRSPGLIFERHATDHGNVVGDTRTAFVYDEAADQFKLGYTDSSADSSSVAFSRLAHLGVNKLSATTIDVQVFNGPIQSPDIAWFTFTLAENSPPQTTVALAGLNKKYGAFDLIVEGGDGNSCGCFRIAKASSADSSFVSMSSAQPGAGGELLSFKWPANTHPSICHAVPRTGGTAALITYRVRYITAIAV